MIVIVLIGWLLGMAFAMGISLIVDTGTWQQPVGTGLVGGVIAFCWTYAVVRSRRQ